MCSGQNLGFEQNLLCTSTLGRLNLKLFLGGFKIEREINYNRLILPDACVADGLLFASASDLLY